ncbi:MAG: radical SAM protein [Candidatus Diapherotrites archaeon]
MKKVLLLSIDLQESFESPAIYCLKAYALKFKEINKSFKIIARHAACQKFNLKKEIEFIKKAKPAALCISCYTWNIKAAEAIARETKKALPETKIVIGGPESSAEIMKRNQAMDVAILGEGERKFYELLRWLDGKKKISEIKGAAYREKGKLKETKSKGREVKLSELPSPYLTGICQPRETIHIEFDRGCPFGCTFCNFGKNEKLEYFPMERIKKEIDYAAENGLEIMLNTATSNLNINEERTIEIFRYLSKLEKKKKARYCIHAHFSHALPYEKTIKAAKEMEIKISPHIGIQTISEKTSKNVNRRLDIGRLKKMLELLRVNGMGFHLYLMTGLPGDNFFTFARGLKFAIDEGSTGIDVNHTLVLNNTQMKKDAKKFKIKYAKKGFPLVISNFSFSEEELKKADAMADSEKLEWHSNANWMKKTWQEHVKNWA